MKFNVRVNGVVRFYNSIPALSRGRLTVEDLSNGEQMELINREVFTDIIVNYVDEMVAHGVRAFVYSYKIKGDNGVNYVTYRRVTPANVKKHPEIYVWNTDGKAKECFPTLCFRKQGFHEALFDEIGIEISKMEYDEFEREFASAYAEYNRGFQAEKVLYGKAQHKQTWSDGKSINHHGKKENTQLKASLPNSSGSNSNTAPIWKGRKVNIII